MKIADDWTQTTDFWCQNQPLYQLSHNLCPPVVRHVAVERVSVGYTPAGFWSEAQ